MPKNTKKVNSTRPFSGLSSNDVAEAGGKGASLGEMTQAGIPVPPGFVVLASAFERFIAETDINVEIDAILDKVDHRRVDTVEHASEKIQALISNATMPSDIADDIGEAFTALGAEFVAVRSSATAEDSSAAAWAGQLDSFLNTTEETLLRNVQRCWASLFTPRAVFYRFEKGLHAQKISVAVVVQKMVASESSGIAFSVHPVTEDYNQLIIEAGFGLGEAIVSGSITPDSYVVEKEPRRIIDTNIATQTRALYRGPSGGVVWHDIPETVGGRQVLAEGEIFELAELIMRIERHYGFPCDIEWAREGGKFYIVQSRPITTLKPLQVGGQGSGGGKVIFQKSYSRDTTLFMQALWAKGLTELAKEKLNWQNPHTPFIAHFVNDGVVEIWEHKEAIQWFLDRLLEKNESDAEFLKSLLHEYRGLLGELKILHAREFLTEPDDIEAYTSLIYRAAFIMTLFFYTGMDERSPKAAQEIAVQGRKEGDFFAENDVFVRNTIARLGNFSNELAGVVLPMELRNLPGRDVLEARLKAFLLIDGGEGCLGSLKAFVEMYPQYVFEDAERPADMNELRGQVAFAGVVRGRACIVKKKGHMANVGEGDILVAPMTTPDFLPAMQRALAFITDEGGITCHAAIVARELKKPCVIGTKIATQVLKDGDLVEVDATRGVVTILQKASEEPRQMSAVLTKIFHAHFPLLMAELTWQGESLRDIPWSAEPFTISPYCVYERKQDGLLHYFFDARGISWKVARAGAYGREAMKRGFADMYARVQKAIEGELALDAKEFAEFVGTLRSLWTWWDGFWWMFEYHDRNGLPKDDLVALRKETEFLAPGIAAVIRNSIARILPHAAKYADVLIADEVLTRNIPTTEVLERRLQGCVYAEGRVYDSLSAVANEFHITFEVPTADHAVELRGQTAYPGKVSGRVRMVHKREELAAFQGGEILVAFTTTPDFLSAMQRAAAIISEHGGAICHAAISSRELKIPCVVGVKGATETLKDGDLVEVDATRGVVTILQKASEESRLLSTNGTGTEQGAVRVLDPASQEEQEDRIVWMKFAARKADLQKSLQFGKGNAFQFAKCLGTKNIERQLYYFDGRTTHMYFDANNYQTFIKSFVEKLHDERFVGGYKALLTKACTDALRTAKRLISRVSTAKAATLSKRFSEFNTAWERFYPAAWAAFYLTNLEEIVRAELHGIFHDSAQADDALKCIATPTAMTPIVAAEEDILRLAGMLVRDAAAARQLAETMADAYGWMSVYNTDDEPRTSAFYLAEAERILAEGTNVDLALAERKLARVEHEKEYRTILRKIKNPLLRKQAALLHILGYLRDKREEVRDRLTMLSRPLYEAIAAEIRLTLSQVVYLKNEEVMQALEGRTSAEELRARAEARKKKFLFTIIGENVKVIDDETSFNRYIQALPQEGNVASITGQSVYGGAEITKGPVRLVLSNKELGKVVEGDILVTSMTKPDFIGAMKKAAAFITDEGGITCHAAIVARELKKPCIIGTKIATQVLKDGDLVEVDATRGIVTILQKASEESRSISQDGAGTEQGAVRAKTEKLPVEEFIIPRERTCDLAPVYWNATLQTSSAVERLYGVTLPYEYNTFEGGILRSVMPKAAWDAAGDTIAHKLLDEKEYIERLKAAATQADGELCAYVENIRERALHDATDAELITFSGGLKDVFHAYDAATVFAWFVAGDQARKLVRERLNISDEDLSDLTMPDEPTFVAAMEERLLRAVVEQQDVNIAAAELTRDYYWIPFGYDGPTVWDTSYFMERLNAEAADPVSVAGKLEGIQRRRKDLKIRAGKLEKAYCRENSSKQWVAVLRLLAAWTDRRKEIEFPLFVEYDRVMAELGARFGLSRREMKFLLTEELPALPERPHDLANEARRRMAQRIATLSRGGMCTVLRTENADVLYAAIAQQTAPADGIVTGTIACRGAGTVYRGIARVVLSSKECDRVREGEFLVSTMTAPDFVPAMNRALGFITDEGGITSHAAIVAREMNKPCIIGTKIATKVLKDGDLVEVDATRGVVTILQKASEEPRSAS